MPKGISLHIGINSVDPVAYGGWTGKLKACEADAKDMDAIAQAAGFTRGQLLTKQATAAKVTAGIRAAARKLKAGDIFFLSYSGHGGQVPDTNNDEGKDPTIGDRKDRKDETWVLYDRMLVDDELYQLWSSFAAGVRILVLSDSCHSGSVARDVPWFLGISADKGRGKPKFMPPAKAAKAYATHKKLYDDIQAKIGSVDEDAVKATVLQISGCQDNQVSYDGTRNGKFTGALRKVWNNGAFKGTYRTFHKAILSGIADYQSPNFYPVGKPNPAFHAQRPFTV